MAAFKRSGLHRLECDCGGYVYATVAALEAHGLPVCPCGAAYAPSEVELAFLLGLYDCDAVREYHSVLARKMHGQAPHGIRGRQLEPAESKALAEVVARRAEWARENRLRALRPAAQPMPF